MENLCTICNRTYASKQSRWNHIKKFHKNYNVKQVVDNIQQVVSKNTTRTLINDNTLCKFCNKKLCDRMYRWKHEKIFGLVRENHRFSRIKSTDIIRICETNSNMSRNQKLDVGYYVN